MPNCQFIIIENHVLMQPTVQELVLSISLVIHLIAAPRCCDDL